MGGCWRGTGDLYSLLIYIVIFDKILLIYTLLHNKKNINKTKCSSATEEGQILTSITENSKTM